MVGLGNLNNAAREADEQLQGRPVAWTPFRLATGARWCRTPDLHRDCPRSERDASAVGLVRRMWLPRIDSHDDDLGQSQAGYGYLTGQ